MIAEGKQIIDQALISIGADLWALFVLLCEIGGIGFALYWMLKLVFGRKTK